MQTSKIKPGETYAMDRRGDLVRFVVQAIHTEKTRSKSLSQIEGYIEEDRKEGEPVPVRKVDPDRLIGPYAEQAELVERKAQEQRERDAKHAEALRLGNEDRCALYAFVGAEVPKVKADEYKQPFYVGYNGTLTIRDDGTKLIVAKVRELQDPLKRLRLVNEE
jgi:hypothetical protein